MSRVNTISVSFEPIAPERVRTLDVHLFVKNTLCLPVSDVLGIQLEYGAVKRFYVKLSSVALCERLVSRQSGEYLFVHGEAASSRVVVRHANSLGVKFVRVFNLPLEVDNKVIADALAPYGIIKSIKNEVWGGADMPYKVPNGVRQVSIDLSRPIPSYVSFGKHGRQQVHYADQDPTCSVCDSLEHVRADCPNKRQPGGWRLLPPAPPTEGQFHSLGQGKQSRNPARLALNAKTLADKTHSTPSSSPSKTDACQIQQPTGQNPPAPTPSVVQTNTGIPYKSSASQTNAGKGIPPKPSASSALKNPGQGTPLSATSVAKGSDGCPSLPEIQEENWADEVERSTNLVQTTGPFSEGPPEENMEFQTTTFKRARDTSPHKRESKRPTTADTPVITTNKFKTLQDNGDQ